MSASATTGEGDPEPGTLGGSRPRLARLRGLWLRFEHLVREVGKFGVVGGSTFVLDTIVYNLVLQSVGGFWAKIISTGVSASAAFLGNRYWTWRDRPRAALHREYLLYFVFNAVGLGIAEGCWWLSHYGLGHFWPAAFHTRLADNISTQVVGTAMGTLFRFWGYRRFVFPMGSSSSGPAAPTTPGAEPVKPAVTHEPARPAVAHGSTVPRGPAGANGSVTRPNAVETSMPARTGDAPA